MGQIQTKKNEKIMDDLKIPRKNPYSKQEFLNIFKSMLLYIYKVLKNSQEEEFKTNYSSLPSQNDLSLQSQRGVETTVSKKDTKKFFWNEEDHDMEGFQVGSVTYKKDQNKKIISILGSGSQGTVYQGQNTKTKKRIVFKQLEHKKEYIYQKEIYKHLLKNQDKLIDFVCLDNLDFDDEYLLIIMTQFECSLKDLAIKQEELYKKNPENPENPEYLSHFNKEEILYIITFLIEAQAKFEEIDLLFHNENLSNILIKNVLVKRKETFKLVIADFGDMVFLQKNQGNNPIKNRIQESINKLLGVIQQFIFPSNDSCNLNAVVEQFIKEFDTSSGFQLEKWYSSILSNCESYKDVLELWNRHLSEQVCKEVRRCSYFQNSDGMIKDIRKDLINQKTVTKKCQSQQKYRVSEKNSSKYIELCEQYIEKKLFSQADQLMKEINLNVKSGQLYSYYQEFAEYYRSQKQLEKAEDFYLKSLKTFENNYGVDCLQSADTLHNLGILYRNKKQLEKAEDFYLKSLKFFENHYGVVCLQSADPLHNLGNIYQDKKQLEKAEDFYLKSLKIKENHYGVDCLQSAVTLHNLGNLYKKKGQCEKADEYKQRSLKIKNQSQQQQIYNENI